MEHSNRSRHEKIRPCADCLPSGMILRNRFVVRQRIAATGLSTVYRGYDRLTGRAIAIKRLSTGQQPGGLPRLSAIRMFVAEAALLETFDHMQVPELYAVFHECGDYYMITQYIAGTPLDQLLEGGGLTHALGLAICASLCDAVEALHRRAIVHADLKPCNIIVLASGRVALVDFGLARRRGEPAAIDEAMGTPPYSPPEQWAGEPLDERSDLYALGRVLEELFTVVCCPALRKAVQPALAKAPTSRFATVAQLRQALAAAYAEEHAQAERHLRRWDAWQLAAILAALAALAVLCLR